MNKQKAIVVSCYDIDGYLLPIGVCFSYEDAEKIKKDFLENNKKSDYWVLENSDPFTQIENVLVLGK